MRLLVLCVAAFGALALVSAACRNIGETGSGTGISRTTSIEVYQTGGFAGADVRYVVDGTVEPQRRSELFDTVGSEAFRALADSYTGPGDCSDAYVYTVTAGYSDGSAKRITTDDCSPTPQLVTDVIARSKEIGHRQDRK
ncbi:hypothetical protein AB0M22_21355 [Nocardia sp. NPDC051756]|uniref:hypothetical protein n=1 Tax=Nocardia sp. NPDC051756 TaxID=3154751 RepID=UPI0034461436